MRNEQEMNVAGGGLAVLCEHPFTIDRQSADKAGKVHSHHYHDSYEIYYLYSGDRYYFIKDRTYHAKRGTLILIKPYVIHCASNYSKNPYERILLTFKKEYVEELAREMSDSSVFACFDRDIHMIQLGMQEQALLESVLNSMLTEYKSHSKYKESFIKSSLLQLLSLSAKHSEDGTVGEVGYKDAVHKTVSDAAAYINNNFSEDITLKELASKYYISSCYLSRTFKRVTGSSFVEYLNGVRIKEAQKLLAKTDMKISAISDAVGFRSTTHFGRAFKSLAGISPIGYRKRYR